MDIPEVIKNIRSELNLSQEGLARELHMGVSLRLTDGRTINRNQIRLQDTLWQKFVEKTI
ncbi:hypothetical protein [Campylobacter devanensis]|uniref:hypothetical protein n=1 Tax=Campylobacter devanensis TaxID=3161138 RepID=UPI00191C75E5|nr:MULTISPECIES: hypothetical protein [unclassified Campylobacter]